MADGLIPKVTIMYNEKASHFMGPAVQ